jgi:predicted DsbA family dithiol-disulfide isomerase|uniref:DSBA-like thioredoxin domain-containing protein n=1 Tax=Haptolina ericina TaxID=156174 RepID=A0A7S3EYP1_9EUKA|mmetsp:Transcript_33315/g.75341  ORF Transcript_33315/g.75341 Transcript_33315/m.75341 type:complete len:237 (+) Transcript_33315:338-1048(+)
MNVTRHPYSFVGDLRGSGGSLPGADAPLTQTWHDALLPYMGNDPAARDNAERGMAAQAAEAGIKLDYGVLAQWQPVDSQRLLLWAARFGLQEEFMSALNTRHFERRQSASKRATLLAAAREVGLDVEAADAFLDGNELEDDVWRSYGETIKEKRIHSIPLFAFSVPSIGAVGGPFRDPAEDEAYVVRGSMSDTYFLDLLEVILRDVKAGNRIFDERASRYRQDEWHGRATGGTCSR